MTDFLQNSAPREPAAFAEWAGRHGIAPLLYADRSVTGLLRDALRERALRAAADEVVRLADLREVLAALDAARVAPLIVKGSALAYRIYPSPELRQRGDTDLLIDLAALPAARAAFAALGFEERMMPATEETYGQTTFARGAHLYDVHWSIANAPLFASLLAIDELRARSVSVPEISEHARTLSDVDALLYACIHRAAHHHGDDRLIWLADIGYLRRRMSADEHRRFWEAAAEREIAGICSQAIEAAGRWFGGESHDLASQYLPAAVLAREERSQKWLQHDQTRASLFAADLAATRGWRAKAQRLRALLFPPRAFMRSQFGTASPLLYAWRMMRGVTRFFRRPA